MRKVLHSTMLLVMALMAQMAMAQTVVTFTAGTDKGNQTSVTTADKVSKDGVTIESTKGAFDAAQYRFGAGSTNSFTTTAGKITKIVFTCTANGTAKYGPGNFTTTDGEYTADGKIGTWTGNASSVVLSTSVQVRATTIEVTVVSDDPNYLAAPVISGDEVFQGSTTVTITAGEGTEIYYTVNGDDPTDDRAERTLYTEPFTISQTTTVQAAAFKGENTSAVTSKTFQLLTLTGDGSLENPYIVADVVNLVNTGAAPSDSVYVKGIVSQAATSLSSYGNVNYYLSDDGTTENQIEAYGSYYFNKADYTDTKQLPAKGDNVVLRGTITKYNDIIELARGNYLVSLNGKTTPDVIETDTLTFTASEALAQLAAGTQPTSVCYITGIISEEVDTTGMTQYGNLTYYISDDGTTDNALYVYRGKSFNGAKFTKDFYLKKGDKVKILGILKNYTYNSTTTPEVDANSKLISVNGATAGVNNVKMDNTNADAPCYNLAGQRVSKNYKGVVIQNGKKFFNNK